MNRAIKAVLLSALIFPGSGHLFLKKYVNAIVFISIFSIPLFLVIADVVNKTNHVIEEIEKGYIPLDAVAISEALSNIMTRTDTQSLNMQVYFMIAVWIIAIIDAYRLAKKEM